MPTLVGIADLGHLLPGVTGVDLLEVEIAAHRSRNAALKDQKAGVPEGQRGGQEAVEPGFWIDAQGRPLVAAEEHLQVAHAEIAAQGMQLAEIEINQPRALGQLGKLILPVIAVGQAAVVPVIVPFAVNRAVPSLFLIQHDLAVGVEGGGEGAGAGTRASKSQ